MPKQPRPRLASINERITRARNLVDDAMYPTNYGRKNRKDYEISFDALAKAEELVGRIADELTEELERYTLSVEDYEFALAEAEHDDV